MPHTTTVKIKAEECNFLDFMDFLSNSFKKWPLGRPMKQKKIVQLGFFNFQKMPKAIGSDKISE